jgi:hypothetical protein
VPFRQYFSVVEKKEIDEFVSEMFLFVCGVRLKACWQRF